MNWYQENRWLGNFLIAFTTCLLLAIWFVFHARCQFSDASALFNEVATERARLEHLNPFPSEENFRKTQTALEDYGASLNKTKQELKTQVLPATSLAPNEFQARLHQAIIDVTERARTNRVKLPGNFHLGFDEFTSALPDTSSSSLLGQQLAEVELLINILIDNRVDAITSLKRPASKTESAASRVVRKPIGGAQQTIIIERDIVELAFNASPSSLRKVLNQIANSERQLFIVRTLHIRNERQEGPSREQGDGDAAPGLPTSEGAIKFIVGDEHVETAGTVELVRFTF
jgi:hypothetical protein